MGQGDFNEKLPHSLTYLNTCVVALFAEVMDPLGGGALQNHITGGGL